MSSVRFTASTVVFVSSSFSANTVSEKSSVVSSSAAAYTADPAGTAAAADHCRGKQCERGFSYGHFIYFSCLSDFLYCFLLPQILVIVAGIQCRAEPASVQYTGDNHLLVLTADGVS